MNYISVNLLEKLLACDDGVDDFIQIYGRTAEIPVDDVIKKAVVLENEHTEWLIDHFSDYMTENFDWSCLDEDEWRWVLTNTPEHANHCDWSKLSGRAISSILSVAPQLYPHADLSKMSGIEWWWLIDQQPMLFEHCNLDWFCSTTKSELTAKYNKEVGK